MNYEIASKWIYMTSTPLIFWPKCFLSSWPSGLRRQTTLDRLDKNQGGAGGKFFFLFLKNFHLSSNFVFPLFFNPYVTFLLMFMTIFHKMAPFFSYEPTVE